MKEKSKLLKVMETLKPFVEDIETQPLTVGEYYNQFIR